MRQKTTNPKFKIVIFPDSQVQGHSLLYRLRDNPSSIGADFDTVELEINDKKIPFMIFDATGNTKFRAIHNQYVKNAHILLLPYMSTNPNASKEIQKHYTDIQDVLPKNATVVLMAVNGQKNLELDNFSEKNHIPHLICSTLLQDQNVLSVFEKSAELFFNKLMNNSNLLFKLWAFPDFAKKEIPEKTPADARNIIKNSVIDNETINFLYGTDSEEKTQDDNTTDSEEKTQDDNTTDSEAEDRGCTII